MLVTDVDVEAIVQVVDAHAFDIVAGNGNGTHELALVHREDGYLRVGQIGGDSSVADVIETIGGVIICRVGRVAFAGRRAVDQRNPIDAVEVLARNQYER